MRWKKRDKMICIRLPCQDFVTRFRVKGYMFVMTVEEELSHLITNARYGKELYDSIMLKRYEDMLTIMMDKDDVSDVINQDGDFLNLETMIDELCFSRVKGKKESWSEIIFLLYDESNVVPPRLREPKFETCDISANIWKENFY